MNPFKDQLKFMREGLREFHLTGSLCPTSSKAAKAMLAPLKVNMTPNCRILEVGPGTGSITKEIIPMLEPGMHLTICEINPHFMDYLKKELETLPEFQSRRAQIHFFLGPIQDLDATAPFDCIVCALPFLNFPREILSEIFDKFSDLSHNKTLMSFYQYIGLRKLREVFCSVARKEVSIETNRYIERQLSSRLISKTAVWLNILPISIYTLNMNPELKPALSPSLSHKSSLASH